MKFATELLHGPRDNNVNGSTITPIFQTASYYQDSAENLEKIFAGHKPGFVYTRISNPTVTNFEQRISAIERGTGAVAFASGMAAISAAVMNVVKSGDEIIANGGLFGGTSALFNELSNFGINIKYATNNSIGDFESLITANSKLIYVETIGNPKLDVADIKALAELAHENNLLLIVDSTVTTPYLIRPLELGADVVIHSTSKIINGGGNSIGGIVITGDNFSGKAEHFPKLIEFQKYGKMSYLARLRSQMLTDFGGCAAPFNVFLTSIGLDTLSLRMERACQNALAIANFLSDKHISVNYPGLVDNPYRNLAEKQFNNRYGFILTINLGTKSNAFKFINSLKLVLDESNIGDARTLVVHPASTIYLKSTESDKINAGVTEDLVRVSVGIEDIEDLLNDFEQALIDF